MAAPIDHGGSAATVPTSVGLVPCEWPACGKAGTCSEPCPVAPESTAARSVTPRPWPENTVPTNEQMAEWLRVCTQWERLAFVQNARYHAEAADRCFRELHDGRLADCAKYRRLGQVVPGV